MMANIGQFSISLIQIHSLVQIHGGVAVLLSENLYFCQFEPFIPAMTVTYCI